MSFREKIAWVKLCAILSVSLLYWLHVPTLIIQLHAHVWGLHALGACIAVYILLEVIGYYVLRMRNPEDASEPKDEREKLIDLKALRIAYYVFVVAVFAGIFTSLHVIDTGPVGVGLVAVVAFVLAEIVKNTARIVFYRRGF